MRAVPQTNRQRAEDFCQVFNEWSEAFGITTPLRTAHFLAQCWHESACLRYLEEIASGAAYDTGSLARRLGNTPERDGDGQRYKGRGIIQITGRANYQAYADSGFCVGNLMAHPEWLSQSPGCYKSAMWFWWRARLSAIADTDNGQNASEICKRITRRINGGYNGLSERQYYLRRFKREFGV
jgi:putative chitinase